MPWKRNAQIAAGVLGFVVVLIGAAAAGGYYFLTSADFRSRVESEASAYSGRSTVTFNKTLLDTQKSVLDVQGQVVLQSQVVKAEVKAHPKSFGLLDLHGPVAIKGKIRSPNVSIARSIPIPTPVFGNAKNVDCGGLTAQLLTGE